MGRRPAARCRAGIRLLLGLIAARDGFGALDENARIDADRPSNQTEYYDGADSKPAASPGKATQAAAAPIINSVTLWQLIDAHDVALRSKAFIFFRTVRPSSGGGLAA